MPYKDLEVRREYDKIKWLNYYAKNKQHYKKVRHENYLKNIEIYRERRRIDYLKNKDKINLRNKTLREERTNFANSFKVKCERCPENDPYCLDFHHLDRKTKSNTVSYLATNVFSKEEIKAEIDKCIVLCANCHRKQTKLERDSKVYSVALRP